MSTEAAEEHQWQVGDDEERWLKYQAVERERDMRHHLASFSWNRCDLAIVQHVYDYLANHKA